MRDIVKEIANHGWDPEDLETINWKAYEKVGWFDGEGTGYVCALYRNEETGDHIVEVNLCTVGPDGYPDDACRYGRLTPEQAEEAIEACKAQEEQLAQWEK